MSTNKWSNLKLISTICALAFIALAYIITQFFNLGELVFLTAFVIIGSIYSIYTTYLWKNVRHKLID
jgi:4-hydroxybenzoate polyprenyltransferase